MNDRTIGRGILDALSGFPFFVTAPLYRRWHLRWRATEDEVRGVMPGDEIVPKASFNATRAITIDAPPEAVWPWIVQMGYRRGGFYTYDLLDNAGYPSADRILDQYQTPRIGEWMPMAKKVNETTAFKVKAFEKEEWLLWEKPDSTWSWKLIRLEGGGTRLISRLKQRYAWESPGSALLTLILLEFGDFAMMRRVLRGIKARAERGNNLTSKTVPPRGEPRRANRWLAFGLITLGGGLVANSLLGPLIGDVIRYRFSETLLNQGIGLDTASLVLVAPLSVGAGILVLRGHPAGPVLALGPAIYTAYMSVQYAVGPEYLVLPGNNERFFPFHLGLFILGTVVAVRAWAAIDHEALPPTSRRAARWFGVVLLALGALLFLRYLPGLIDLMGGEPSVPEYLENPTTFFLIALMDLGVFLPAAVGAGIALRGEAPWARKALYGIVAWFALVGVAVAAMTITMQVNDDPAASVGQTATFIVAAVVFVALALRVHWPLFGRRRGPRVGRQPMAT